MPRGASASPGAGLGRWLVHRPGTRWLGDHRLLWQRHRGLLVSCLDQGLLSALSLGISVLFIHAAPKTEFGLYTLVSGLVLLTTGVEGALVVTPLLTAGSRLCGDERARFVAGMARIARRLGLALGALLGAGVALHAVLGRSTAVDRPWLAPCAALAVVGAWAREFQRSSSFLDGRAAEALRDDACYAALVALGLGLYVGLTGRLEAAAALGVLGGAALATSGGALHRRSQASPQRLSPHRPSPRWPSPRWPSPHWPSPHWPSRDAGGEVAGGLPLGELLAQGRWTLPGMGVSWMHSTGYSYAVATLAGSAVVAELAAARLFIMPINLLVTAWQRVFLPAAGARLGALAVPATAPAAPASDGTARDNVDSDGAGGERAQLLYRMARRSIHGLLAVTAAYLLGLGLFFALGGERWLPPKYGRLGLLVLAWGGYLVASTARSVPLTALLAERAFRTVFVFNVVAFAVSLPLVGALLVLVGPSGAVAGLVAGELALTLLAWCALARRCAPSSPERDAP